MKSDLVDIEVTVHTSTEKAWLVESDVSYPKRIWLPKSQCEVTEIERPSKRATLTAPESYLIEKGLV